MEPQRRVRVLFAATLLMVSAAFWGVKPAMVAGFGPQQNAPEAGLPPAHPNPAKTLTLEQRADIFMARKNFGDAADYYYRALKQSSYSSAVLWNKLGIAYQQESKFATARKAYINSTRVDKNFAEAWNNLGTVYFMEGEKSKSSRRFAQSVKYYLHAIELAANNATFHLNLGTSYYHLKKFDQAVEEYRTALGIDPSVVTQASVTGTVLHASAEDVEYYFYMAKAFASVGNAEEAVRYLRRALEDGFGDAQRINEDPDFKKISQYPAFIELMRNPPVAIKN